MQSLDCRKALPTRFPKYFYSSGESFIHAFTISQTKLGRKLQNPSASQLEWYHLFLSNRLPLRWTNVLEVLERSMRHPHILKSPREKFPGDLQLGKSLHMTVDYLGSWKWKHTCQWDSGIPTTNRMVTTSELIPNEAGRLSSSYGIIIVLTQLVMLQAAFSYTTRISAC